MAEIIYDARKVQGLKIGNNLGNRGGGGTPTCGTPLQETLPDQENASNNVRASGNRRRRTRRN